MPGPSPSSTPTRILLEVIVESVADAREAASGGADRLEVVRALDVGGLTPPLELVQEISRVVSLPLRVMVRSNGGYGADAQERATLRREAAAIAASGIDGLVIGFAEDGQPRIDQVLEVIGDSSGVRVTFHRAFDQLADPLRAIGDLTQVPSVDRILTSGGEGSVQERCERLADYQQRADGRITIIAGGGVDDPTLAEVVRTRCVREVHVGRLARAGGRQHAPVDRMAVARIRLLLDAAG